MAARHRDPGTDATTADLPAVRDVVDHREPARLPAVRGNYAGQHRRLGLGHALWFGISSIGLTVTVGIVVAVLTLSPPPANRAAEGPDMPFRIVSPTAPVDDDVTDDGAPPTTAGAPTAGPTPTRTAAVDTPARAARAPAARDAPALAPPTVASPAAGATTTPPPSRTPESAPTDDAGAGVPADAPTPCPAPSSEGGSTDATPNPDDPDACR